MPLFSSTSSRKDTHKDSGEPRTPAEEEPKRPGTSGTENLLMTSRRQAAQEFQKAQKAEQTYRSKKRATVARKNYHDAKEHFKECGRHLRLGMKMMLGAVKSIPYIFAEKKDERRRARATASRKRLEERLAKTPDAENAPEAKPEAADS
jgi:hypothetical protein